MNEKIIIDGKEYKAKVSALLPRLYRRHFGRDILADLRQLEEANEKTKKDGGELGLTDLTVFEDLCWLMLKHGGENVGESPDEWLDSISGIFDVYKALPQILDLWKLNEATTSTPAKK